MTNTVKFYLGLIPVSILVFVAEATIPASVTNLALWMGVWVPLSYFLGFATFLAIGITSIFGAVAVAQEMEVSLSPKTKVIHTNDNNVLRLHQGGKDHNK